MRSKPSQRFAGARVLAIDLSLTSLAYALRKTRELGVGNIDYAQADILKLDTIGRTLRRHRVLRRAAPHGRSVRRLAHAAVGAAAGRPDGGRALQRDRAGRHRQGAGLHRRARLRFERRRHPALPAGHRRARGRSGVQERVRVGRLLQHQRLPRSAVPRAGASPDDPADRRLPRRQRARLRGLRGRSGDREPVPHRSIPPTPR